MVFSQYICQHDIPIEQTLILIYTIIRYQRLAMSNDCDLKLTCEKYLLQSQNHISDRAISMVSRGNIKRNAPFLLN